MENAVEFKNIWKKFKTGESANSLRDAVPLFFKGLSGKKKEKNIFWALKDVSFNLKKGRTLGIIGPNGAGKTTILKLIAGIMKPNKGSLRVNGRISSLIEVGAGFHPDLTGRENIYLNGSIMGMSRGEIAKKFDSIVEFSGIKDFIDTPVKRYSSGMYVRLGFSVAVHTEPDVLLVDEVLAVGDVNFRIKCIDKIKQFQEEGKTIIFISHEMSTIKKICQSCLWLNNGKIEKSGEPHDVVDLYMDQIKGLSGRLSAIPSIISDMLEVVSISVKNRQGVEKKEFEFGETLIIRVRYSLVKPISGLIFGVAIYGNDDICLSALNTGLDAVAINGGIGENEVEIVFPAINLLSGTYSFDIAFLENKAIEPFFYLSKACKITVKSPFLADGLFVMEHKWQNK